MAIGDSIDGCRVAWKELGERPRPGEPRSGSSGLWRRLASVQVRHVARNTVEWTRPQSGAVVRKRLTGKWIEVIGPDGSDLAAAWREGPDRA